MMGRFLEIHNNKDVPTIITPEIDAFMESKGFRIDTSAYGGEEKGWCKGYYDKSGSYFYRIHITRVLVQVHYEYESGGLLSGREYEVNPEHITDVDTFIRFLDPIYEKMDI